MSVAEINSAIDRLTPEERARVSAHLRERFCSDSPERSRELGGIMEDMDVGRRFTVAELRQKDSELKDQGR